MIVIINKIIPFKGNVTVNLFCIVFARKDEWEKASELQKQIYLRHNDIHSSQQRELLWVFYYIVYFFEWLFLLMKYRNGYKAYMNVSFEKEAFRYELNPFYLQNRKHWAQWRHSD